MKKLKATASDYRLKFKNIDDRFAIDALPLLAEMFEDILQHLTGAVAERDMVRLILQAPELERPISLPFIKRDKLTVRRILTKIEIILQSHKTLKLDENVILNFLHLELPVGGKPRKTAWKSWEQKKKNSVIS